MGKRISPEEHLWRDIKARTEAKWGLGWQFLGPEQRQGAYAATTLSTFTGFAAMADPGNLVEILVYVNRQIVDEVLRDEEDALTQ